MLAQLSLYDPTYEHLCLGDRGMGALPMRGSLMTAVTLNNLAVYHRRRGQGRASYKCLQRACQLESAGNTPIVAVHTNVRVVVSPHR